jgi:menaquinone-specific isochorismate synthase
MPRNEACRPPETGRPAIPPARAGAEPSPRWIARPIDPVLLNGVDLDAITEAASSFPLIRWTDSSKRDRWLGLGAADDLTARDVESAWMIPTLCRERLATIGGPASVRGLLRYFGGIAFDPRDEAHPEWISAGRGRFILPRIILRQSWNGGATAGVEIVSSSAGTAQQGMWEGGSVHLEEDTDPRWRSRRIAPPPLAMVPIAGERQRWIESVRLALAAIESGRIRKVVLSRDFLLSAPSGDLDPAGLVRKIESQLAHGHMFCFRFDRDAAFLGATPERLVSLAGTTMRCDCLAGTGPRGMNGQSDDSMAALLLGSDKDLREHRFVRDGIVASLEPVTRWIEVETRPAVLRLAGLHHLSTSIRGALSDGVALGDLLRRLHPTPAVGGSPRDPALEMIRRLEGRPRGWYAGSVGWVALDEADFAVAIRSGIVRGGTLRAFAGAGIVSGSDPEAEWDETARKAASFLNLFTEAVL